MDLQFQEISNLSKKTRCGCYVSEPEFVKQYPKQYIMVPLKSSEYSLQIANSIANVQLLQTYYNPTSRYLQLEYNFPINPNACVYRFVATFGSKRMEGIVKEKEQARIEYNQAIKEGKKAAYGEINADSKDILTLKVGNVAPKETVKIEIVYLQELTLACNMFYQLHMMGTISPRYMNYIPGELIKAGLRNDSARSQGNFYWNFKIQLKTTRKVHFFDSNSHDIELVSQNDARTESVFAMSKSCVPNKDFIFSYTTQGYELPSYVFGRTDAGSTAMISFIPKFCTLNIDDAYKASVYGKGYQTDIQNAKGEYIFLLDRSGSMGGSRMEKAKEALILFIKSLPEDTFFNVISFGSNNTKLFPNSKKYSDDEVKSAVQKIKKMSADMGGTEIYQPLLNQITDKPIDGYPKQIFLLTDGGVSNTEGVIRMVGLNNKFSRVHTIGIGNGCSEQLILGCAKKGKGYHVFITDQEDPSQKIIQLLTDSLSPVISKLKLSFDKSIVDSIIPNPESMPYILKNQLVNFYITFKGQLAHQAKFEFSYEDTLNKKPYAAEIEVDPNAGNESFIDRMAHFKKIRLLEQSYNSGLKIEQNMYYVKVVDTKAEIIKQSVKHQILSELTAFVCTEKELVDGKYQEIKQTGKLKIQIINPPPIEYQEKESYRPSTNMKMKKFENNLGSMNFGSMPAKKAEMVPAMAPAAKMAPKIQMESAMSMKKSSEGFFDSVKSFFGVSKPQSSLSLKQSASSSNSRRARGADMLIKECSMQQQSLKMRDCAEEKLQFNKLFQIENMKAANIEAQNCRLDNLSLMEDEEDYEPIEIKKAERSVKAEQRKQALEKKRQKKQKRPLNKPQPALNITQLICQQTTEGSWKDIDLIGRLLGEDVQKAIASEGELIVVITYLIAKWIEKNHPEKQYSLVVKKGLNFAKKCGNLDKLSQAYDQFIK